MSELTENLTYTECGFRQGLILYVNSTTYAISIKCFVLLMFANSTLGQICISASSATNFDVLECLCNKFVLHEAALYSAGRDGSIYSIIINGHQFVTGVLDWNCI